MQLLFIGASHTLTPFETNVLSPQCYGTSCYIIYIGSYSWFGAHARCHSQGLTLAIGSPNPQFADPLVGTWIINAHRIWYNLNGPAFANGSLLSTSRFRMQSSGSGDCFKLSSNSYVSVNCKEVLDDVSFGCALRENIDYLPTTSTATCPPGWQSPQYSDLRLALCTLQIPVPGGTHWDNGQAMCIARGGRLFAVRNDLEALWLEQLVRTIPTNSFNIRDVLVDLHEHIYCTDGWCWANGKRNVSAIIPWLTGLQRTNIHA